MGETIIYTIMAKNIYGGTGQNFDKKYSVDSLMYPSDLAAEKDNQYGDQRVIFYINIQGGGKISKADINETLTMEIPESRFAEYSGTQARASVIAGAGNVADFGGAVADKTGLTFVSNKVSDKTGHEFKRSEMKIQPPKKRLKTAICLYVPEQLSKSYSVNWSQESSESMMAGAVASELLSAGGKAAVGIGGGGLAKLWEGVSGGAKVLGGSVLAKSAPGSPSLQKTMGVGPGNSKAEFLFSGVEFGSFTFDYRFAPRSADEAKKVLNIVRTFRHHMLPEYVDDANFLYIYPSEFEIRYYIKEKENDFLERHMTAVLKNMSINYTSMGQMTTFEDGMPTHINITLQFQELSVPTKETSPSNAPGA